MNIYQVASPTLKEGFPTGTSDEFMPNHHLQWQPWKADIEYDPRWIRDTHNKQQIETNNGP
jgi:hypothetical protein